MSDIEEMDDYWRKCNKEMKVYEIFEQVKKMSFEEGKTYILSCYPEVKIHENSEIEAFGDGDGGVYDCDFIFDENNDELVISFTAGYAVEEISENENEEIIDYENGYWHN